jgi:hypothetical protein
MRNIVRVAVLLAAVLAYGLIAHWAQAEADRAFDERMRRDRTELVERLDKAGVGRDQVAAIAAYEAAVSHHVATLVRSTSTISIAMLVFLGVTLVGVVASATPDQTARPPSSGARSVQAAASGDDSA